MTRHAASASLADALAGWAPGAGHNTRRVDPWPAAAFAYRLVKPAFAGAVIEATAHRTGADLDLTVGVAQGGPSLTATATMESS